LAAFNDPAYDKLIDLKPADPGVANDKSANRNGADGERTYR
jgi:hypothetical protein